MNVTQMAMPPSRGNWFGVGVAPVDGSRLKATGDRGHSAPIQSGAPTVATAARKYVNKKIHN